MFVELVSDAPVQVAPDGARSCRYSIVCGDRVVGGLELKVESSAPQTGHVHFPAHGRSDQGANHSASVVTAAERLLRDWGCTTVRVRAPRREAEELLAKLGYRSVSRIMVKELGTRPDLPPSVGARTLTQEEFEAFVRAAQAQYALSFVGRGFPLAEAEKIARSATTSLLPNGLATQGFALRCLVEQEEVVGRLWVADSGPAPEPGAYVYDVEVAEGRRGRGFGRALMLHAEQIAWDWGCRRMGLNVFEGNTVAERLYASLGYRTTLHSIARDL
ncbi:GNAT family N-acetyltransferase [Streptomyces flaveolus]|uniref:GNAT family N-acetyltransferase n=1 Tax=Streptomyces flaveolus TaxID=67297 RepID=UPI0034213C8D